MSFLKKVKVLADNKVDVVTFMNVLSKFGVIEKVDVLRHGEGWKVILKGKNKTEVYQVAPAEHDLSKKIQAYDEEEYDEEKASEESKDRLLSIADVVATIIKGKVGSPSQTGEVSWLVAVQRTNPPLELKVATEGPDHDNGGIIYSEDGKCTPTETTALRGLARKSNVDLEV